MSLLARIELGNERYPALTGIRALGASAVFFDHFPIWPDAHLTVNVMAFFYALSGFLIVRIYYEQAQLRLRWLAEVFHQSLRAHLSGVFPAAERRRTAAS